MEAPDPPCRSDWTVYDVFDDQQADPLRSRKGTSEPLGDLIIGGSLDLTPARDAANNAVRDYLPVPFGRAIERKVTASFDYLRGLRSLAAQHHGLLAGMVKSQDRHLIEAVTRPAMPPAEGQGVLVAFSVIEDQTIILTQKELDRLIAEVAKRGTKMGAADVCREARSRADAGLNKRGGKLDDEACDEIDVLALVLVLMRREGLKPAVKNPALQQWLIAHFNDTPSCERTFGGAAGNETFMLRSLGLPVLLHVPYHHTEQASIAPRCAKRLVSASNGPQRPFPSLNLGNPDDPRRFSFVLQVTPEVDANGKVVGPKVVIDGQEYVPSRSDRVILRLPNPRKEDRADLWQTLRVLWRSSDGQERCEEVARDALSGYGPDDWPYLPVFQHPAVLDSTTKTVSIELASADEMKQLRGAVGVALLGGVHLLGKKFVNDKLTSLLRDALVEQLQALGASGISLHLELSGVDSGVVLDELRVLLKNGGVTNVSLNREELTQITSEYGSSYFTFPRGRVPDDAMGVYCRAVELLNRLEMDTIYIHDAELDLLVRRNPEREEEKAGKDCLNRHRRAMLLAKAAVPAALLRRAGVTQQNWDLALCTESLAALMAFADDYARLVASKTPGATPADILNAVLTDGFYHPGHEGISVAVAPTIHVDLRGKASLSGAGDMCFAARNGTAG